MSRKLSATEKSLGRSEGYHDLEPSEQWAEDKRLGILDWDGSDDDAEELVQKNAPGAWCSCAGWMAGWRYLTNHEAMNFCMFCGKKLKK